MVLTSILLSSFIIISCGQVENENYNYEKQNIENVENKNPLDEARNNVIDKWKNDANVLGTTRYIEDIYKSYPNDNVISNIYFYVIAKESYDSYLSTDISSYYDTAVEYASKIDPNYSDEFSNEIQLFASDLIVDTQNRTEVYNEAKEKVNNYSSLTNNDKKDICNYIQSRYDYYDSIEGSYSGDKYTDQIWKEAEEKYNLTSSQLDQIWMYSYKY